MSADDFENLIEEVEEMIRLSCEIDQLPCYRGLYKCQKEALQKILKKYFKKGSVSGIVQMPTGTGKTVLAAALILSLWKYYLTKRKNCFLVFFLVPRIIIRRQVRKKFEELLEIISRKISSRNAIKVIEASEEESGNSIAESVCNILRNVHYFKNHTRYVRSANSLNLVLVTTPQLIFHYLPSECLDLIKKNTDVLIMDEIHTYYIGDKTIRRLEELLSSKLLPSIPISIGLTATPVQEAIKLFSDGIIYSYSSYKAMNDGILVKDLKLIQYVTSLHKLRLYNDRPHTGIDEWRVAIRNRARMYAERIKEVIETIRKEANTKRVPKTLVVSPNVTEADYLHDELRKYFGTVVYKAHYREKEPHKNIEDFKNSIEGILVAVDMANIGFDDPNLEVLIIARPVTNPIAYVQLRGRILRKPALNKYKDTDDNIKKALNYAVIVDLVGKKDIIELESLVPDVESGKYGVKDLEGAFIQLKGYSGTTLEAEAKIDIKCRKEILLSEILNWKRLLSNPMIGPIINAAMNSYKLRITEVNRSELVLKIYRDQFITTIKVPRIVNNYCEVTEQIMQQLISDEKFRKSIKNTLEYLHHYYLIGKLKARKDEKLSKILRRVLWGAICRNGINKNKFMELFINDFVNRRVFPKVKHKIIIST